MACVEAEAAKAPTDLIKTPKPFKKDTKWRPWKESFMTYLYSKSGQASIPLAYIIHEYDVPLPNVIYPTIHDEMVACAVLQGPEFNLNNGIVFDLLQPLTHNSMKTRTKQECYDEISKAVNKGQHKSIRFHKLCDSSSAGASRSHEIGRTNS